MTELRRILNLLLTPLAPRFSSQNTLVGVVLASLTLVGVSGSSGAAAPEGRTLISVASSSTTNLIELDGTVVQSWHGSSRPSSMAYLLDDGSIVCPQRHDAIFFPAGGVGGRIQRISNEDVVVWDYVFASSGYQQHHDIEPMPNGNILLIAWERRTAVEAVAAGRTGAAGEMWPTYIVEVEPVGANSGNLVWEWRIWDHIIQDSDPGKPNFGVVADHPERLSINVGSLGDWVHVNAIDYDPDSDQILFSSRSLNEVYVIDHSTTTAEAAGSTGGNSGMGGDILYRWGNPQQYDRGDESNKYLSVVHGANWIDKGLPGGGNILLFHNGDRPGGANDYSAVVEIAPPRYADETYQEAGDDAYGPSDPTWVYGGPGDFYGGPVQCGAFRQPNGNTMISLAGPSELFEVSAAGDVVWTYNVSGGVNRAQRYYELDPATTPELVAESGLQLRPGFPNPFRGSTELVFVLPSDGKVNLSIISVTGERLVTLRSGWCRAGEMRVAWSGHNFRGDGVPSGVYLARLSVGSETLTQRLVLQR